MKWPNDDLEMYCEVKCKLVVSANNECVSHGMTERQKLGSLGNQSWHLFNFPQHEAITNRVANFFSCSSTLLFFFITLRRGEPSSFLTSVLL